MEPEDTLFARIDTELYEARRLLERGDVAGAQIAAWAARQLSEQEDQPTFTAECDHVIRQCDIRLAGVTTVDLRESHPNHQVELRTA